MVVRVQPPCSGCPVQSEAIDARKRACVISGTRLVRPTVHGPVYARAEGYRFTGWPIVFDVSLLTAYRAPPSLGPVASFIPLSFLSFFFLSRFRQLLVSLLSPIYSFSSLMGRSLIHIISIGNCKSWFNNMNTYLIIGSWRMKVKENLSLLIFLKVIDRRIKSRDERDNFSPIYSQLRSRRIRIGWHASIRRFPI